MDLIQILLLLACLLGTYILKLYFTDPLAGIDDGIKIPEPIHNLWGAFRYIDREVGMRRMWIWGNKYPVFKFHVFRRSIVAVADADLAKEFFHHPLLQDKDSQFYPKLADFVGKTSILTTSGEAWKAQHKLILPVFRTMNMEQFFFPAMLDCAQSFVFKMKQMIHDNEHAKPNLFPSETISINKYCSDLTLDVITRAMFNVNLSSENDNTLAKICQAIEEGATETQRRISRPWRKYNPLASWNFHRNNAILRSEMAKLVDNRRKRLNNNTDDDSSTVKSNRDLVDLMLVAKDPDTGESLSDETIIDQCLTFFLAGHDTTAHTLTWILWVVANHPEVEQKLLEEIDSVLGDDTEPSYQSIGKLQYTNAIIKEALRMYDPAPGTGRQAKEDLTFAGYKIPKGTSFICMFNPIHYSEKHYKDPLSFRPERWLSEETATLHPYAYVPFSKVDRSCIGQKFALLELKSLIAVIYKQLIFRPAPWRTYDLTRRVTIQPVDIYLVPKERKYLQQ